VEDVPILLVNQALAQLDDQGSVILTLGQVAPPITVGTPEQQLEQLQATAFVQVRPVARVTMSPQRIADLVKVLQQTIENQERVQSILRSKEGGSTK